MIPLLLYSTMDRRKVPFQPIRPPHVGLYSCGPTVYDYAHLGNLRTFLFVDSLKRVLAYRGFTVTHVMNITDVGHLTNDSDSGDDKLELASAREQKTAWEVAAFYTEAFLRDMERLNVLHPTVMPRATDHIPEQIALIEQLERRGFTYRTSDGIYFDAAKLRDYGKLARLSEQELVSGARVEVNREKLHPRDFALWKFSPPGSTRHMEWASPWGKGWPGWHIECSAMSVRYLGQPFDLHTGGIDHIAIHHTNEIAQSEAATSKTLANYWLHGEFLVVDAGRMGKSEGNLLTLDQVVERGIDPLSYRLFVLSTHYRHPLKFTWSALAAASNGLANLRAAVARLDSVPGRGHTGSEPANHTPGVQEAGQVPAELDEAFVRAISDDLNLPQALAVLQHALKSDRPDAEKLAAVAAWDGVFGLKLMDARSAELPLPIAEQLAAYEAARHAKNFATSDTLRAELTAEGYTVEDLADGSSRLLPIDRRGGVR